MNLRFRQWRASKGCELQRFSLSESQVVNQVLDPDSFLESERNKKLVTLLKKW